MGFSAHPLDSLTIAISASNSDTLAQALYAHAAALSIAGPAALTGTITIEGRVNATDWKTVRHQYSEADLNIGADEVVLVPYPGRFQAIRVHSSDAEAAARTFPVSVVNEMS